MYTAKKRGPIIIYLGLEVLFKILAYHIIYYITIR
jgi:hypothetical protein